MAAPLVQSDDAAASEGDGARLEGLDGWVVEIGAVYDPLENEELCVVKREIHTFSLTAVF